MSVEIVWIVPDENVRVVVEVTGLRLVRRSKL